jgi:hypothetical protein
VSQMMRNRQELWNLVAQDDEAAFGLVLELAKSEFEKAKWHCRPWVIRALGTLARPRTRCTFALPVLIEGAQKARRADNPVGLAASAVALGLLGERSVGAELNALYVSAARSSMHEMNIAAGHFAVSLAVLRCPEADRDQLREESAGYRGQIYWAQHSYAFWLLEDLAGARTALATGTLSERDRSFASSALHDAQTTVPAHQYLVWQLGLQSALDAAHDPDADDHSDVLEREALRLT